MSYYDDIKQMQKHHRLDYDGPPRELPDDKRELRRTLLREEVLEYDDPCPEEKLDALVDIVVVAIGTACDHGYDFDEAWRRVLVTNMAKVRAKSDGSDSKRGSPDDLVKPENWVPPDLKDLVEKE